MPTEPPASAIGEATPLPPPPRSRLRPWAWAGLPVLALVVLAPWAGWQWLWHHPAALPWLLQQVPGLQVVGLTGTLAGGDLRAQSLTWHGGAGPALASAPGRTGPMLQIDGLAVQMAAPAWRPHAGVWVGLHLASVTAQRLTWRSGPPTDGPLPRPADLKLPASLRIDALRIETLQIDDLPVVTGLTVGLALGAQAGAEHQLTGLAAQWQGIQWQGQAQVGSAADMPFHASLSARQAGTAPWSGQMTLDGPLDTLQARLQLDPATAKPGPADAATVAAPLLTAQAELQPFAAWPLGTLTLATRSLDLSSLLPTWPHTQIDGNAQLQIPGMDQAAHAQVRLDNRQAGPWAAQRLPVSQLVLSARARPGQTTQGNIDAFTLTLAGSGSSAGTVTGTGQWQDDRWQLDAVLARLKPALLHPQAADLVLDGPVQLRLSGLPSTGPSPSPVATAPPAALKWQADVHLTGQTLGAMTKPVALTLKAAGDLQQLHITECHAQAGDALADLTLDARQDAGTWALKGQGRLTQFDPRPWWRGPEGSAWRQGPHRINGALGLDLRWRDQPRPAGPALPSGDTAPTALMLDRALAALDGDAHLQITDSLLAGVPLAADAQITSQAGGLQLGLQLNLGGNQLDVKGQRGGAAGADQWQVQWQAPALASLAPLGRLWADLDPTAAGFWPAQGAFSGSAQAQGRWPSLRTQGEAQVSGLTSGTLGLQSAQLSWATGSTAEAPMQARLTANGLSDGNRRLDQLSASVTGSLRQHSLDLRLDSPAQPPAWTENLLGPAGSGTRLQITGQGQWQSRQGVLPGGEPALRPPGTWRLRQVQLQGGARDKAGGSRPWLAAQDLSMSLQLGDQGQALSLKLDPGRLMLLDTALRWQEASWQAASTGQPARLDLTANLESFNVASMLARAQPLQGWGGDLALSGKIEVHSQDRFDADLVLERQAGDLTLTDDLGVTQALGVSDLRLALSAHDGLWQLAQGLAGTRIGEMAGAQLLRTDASRTWPPADAPLQGVVEARVANLGIWGTWVPPGWRLSGNLRTSASFGGTLGAPEVRGEMVGTDLGVRNVLQGVNVHGGDLALTLAGDSARIDRFLLKGGDGSLTISGQAALGAKPSAHLSLQADHFRLLGRIDRRLVASGRVDLALDAQQLRLDGGFTVDEGLIDLSQAEAPKLDSDVQVRRGESTRATTPDAARAPTLPVPLRQPQVKLKIALGQQLRLRGHGVDTGLRGELAVTSPDGRLALHGVVSAEGGSVAAYGQKLEIERGTVSFRGALDNPVIDVLAIRPNLDVKVGVQVSGAAQKPRIRLVSEPELADFDKLSWLVLGRSPDGLGRTDTALLQRAALALLSGEGRSPTDTLLENIGLTDFSVRQSDGDTRETIVSLGRQLSRRWYLGYERSVNATAGTWQLVYRLAQRFTLRAQSGTDNALDVIWSWRW